MLSSSRVEARRRLRSSSEFVSHTETPSGTSVAARKMAIRRLRRRFTAAPIGWDRSRASSIRRFGDAAGAAEHFDQAGEAQSGFVEHRVAGSSVDGSDLQPDVERLVLGQPQRRQGHAFDAPVLRLRRREVRSLAAFAAHAGHRIGLLPKVVADHEALEGSAAGRRSWSGEGLKLKIEGHAIAVADPFEGFSGRNGSSGR